jgi:hypothetical protein
VAVVNLLKQNGYTDSCVKLRNHQQHTLSPTGYSCTFITTKVSPTQKTHVLPSLWQTMI